MFTLTPLTGALLTEPVLQAVLALAVVASGRHLGLAQVHLHRLVASRRDNDRGEGVISMAIAVLIVAFLGVAMWLAFKGFADDTERTLEDQVDRIGG